jgi:hypothetical protein
MPNKAYMGVHGRHGHSLRPAWNLAPGAAHARAYGLALAEGGQAQAGLQLLARRLTTNGPRTPHGCVRSLIALEQKPGMHQAACGHALGLQRFTEP